MTMTDGGGGGGKTGKKNMLAKLSKHKVVDPFEEEERIMLENMQAGISTLIDMHNMAELSSLCGTIGLAEMNTEGSFNDKKRAILASIASEAKRFKSSERAHAEVLKLMWDGILYEYLRAVGQPLRTSASDPRAFVLQYWRKAAAKTGGAGAFRPHYVPRHVRTRNERAGQDEDIMSLLQGCEVKEVAVKHAEIKIRKEHDYRNVVLYLAAVTALHNFERDGRHYLVNEVEGLRAKLEHTDESLEIVSAQLEELEARHEAMGAAFSRQLAEKEATSDMWYRMVAADGATERHFLAALMRQFLEHKARGNHKPEELLLAVFEKYNTDTAALEQRALQSEHAVARGLEQLRKTGEVLRLEAARADRAEAEVREARARYDALLDASADQAATDEAQVDIYYALACDNSAARGAAERRVASVTPALLSALVSPSPELEALGAVLLEALGAMDREAVLQRLEQNHMAREELTQRTKDAVRLVAPPKAAKGKGGKGGKGGKKGGAKGKKKKK